MIAAYPGLPSMGNEGHAEVQSRQDQLFEASQWQAAHRACRGPLVLACDRFTCEKQAIRGSSQRQSHNVSISMAGSQPITIARRLKYVHIRSPELIKLKSDIVTG